MVPGVTVRNGTFRLRGSLTLVLLGRLPRAWLGTARVCLGLPSSFRSFRNMGVVRNSCCRSSLAETNICTHLAVGPWSLFDRIFRLLDYLCDYGRGFALCIDCLWGSMWFPVSYSCGFLPDFWIYRLVRASATFSLFHRGPGIGFPKLNSGHDDQAMVCEESCGSGFFGARHCCVCAWLICVLSESITTVLVAVRASSWGL